MNIIIPLTASLIIGSSGITAAYATEGLTPRAILEQDALVPDSIDRSTVDALLGRVLASGHPCRTVSGASLLTPTNGFLLACDHYTHTYTIRKHRMTWEVAEQ